MRKILITGSEGFVGKNLQVQLRRRGDVEIIPFDKEHSLDYLKEAVDKADFIFHLAGENRPKDPADFMKVNKGLTETLTELVSKTGRKILITYTSSIQAELDNEYGKSKKAAEDARRSDEAAAEPIAAAAAATTVPEGASPVGGWDEFIKWTARNIRYPEGIEPVVRQVVTVSFMVQPDSTLSDLRAVSSPGEPFTREAFRLLREGPKWVPSGSSNKTQAEGVVLTFVFR